MKYSDKIYPGFIAARKRNFEFISYHFFVNANISGDAIYHKWGTVYFYTNSNSSGYGYVYYTDIAYERIIQ